LGTVSVFELSIRAGEFTGWRRERHRVSMERVFELGES